MIDESIGDEYLDHFNRLNLDLVHNRRIGMFLLENYFGLVQTEILNEVFDIHRNDNIAKQWDKIDARLQNIDGFEVPAEYESTVKEAFGRRHSVYHNFDEGIDREYLKNLRNTAPEWRDWLISQSKDYYSHYGRYTRHEVDYTFEFVNAEIDRGQYSRAINYLKQEIDYALRILLKSAGVYPSLRNKLMLSAFHSDEIDGIDEEVARKYTGLKRSMFEIENGEDMDERQAEILADNGKHILNHVFSVLSPFESVASNNS